MIYESPNKKIYLVYNDVSFKYIYLKNNTTNSGMSVIKQNHLVFPILNIKFHNQLNFKDSFWIKRSFFDLVLLLKWSILQGVQFTVAHG